MLNLNTKTINTLCAVLLPMLLAGCGNNGGGNDLAIPIHGDITVELDSVASPTLLNATSMAISGKYLAVVNSGRNSIMDIFTLPECSYAGSGIRIGEGPDEVIGVNFMSAVTAGDNRIALMTELPGTLALVELPGMDISQRICQLPGGWDFVHWLVPLPSGQYLAQQGNLPMDWAIVDGQREIVSLFPTELPEATTGTTDTDEFRQMIARSAVGVHSGKEDMTAICFRTVPRIALFDANGNCTALLRHDVAWQEGTVWIVAAQSGEDSFFVNLHNPEDTTFTCSTILEIDWDGEILHSFNVPKCVGAFAVEPESRTLYFTTYHDSDYIYTAKL